MKINKPNNFKDAVVEQIVLWIVIFMSFITLLFFVIDYSNAIKANENAESLSQYGSRMIALNKDTADIISGMNNIKGNHVSTIQEDDLTCVEDSSVSNRQVIVNIYATLDNNFLSAGDNNIHSKTVVFNESSEFQKECSLTLSFN